MKTYVHETESITGTVYLTEPVKVFLNIEAGDDRWGVSGSVS